VIATGGDGALSGSQVQLEEIATQLAPATLENVSERFENSLKRPRFLKGCRTKRREVSSRRDTVWYREERYV
jgi:hypothetical protein